MVQESLSLQTLRNLRYVSHLAVPQHAVSLLQVGQDMSCVTQLLSDIETIEIKDANCTCQSIAMGIIAQLAELKRVLKDHVRYSNSALLAEDTHAVWDDLGATHGAITRCV